MVRFFVFRLADHFSASRRAPQERLYQLMVLLLKYSSVSNFVFVLMLFTLMFNIWRFNLNKEPFESNYNSFFPFGFFKCLFTFRYREPDQTCSSNNVCILKPGQFINQTRCQKNSRHIYTDLCTVGICQDWFGI